MITSTLFTQINSAYRGSDDDAPAVGTTDYTLWLGTINRKQNEWATDADNDWSSLFELRTMGTIATGTQSYDLDDDFMAPSDSIIVTTPTGDVEYRITKPGERGRYMRSVYISGHDPKVLTFYDTIVSTNPIVGGALKVPGFFLPSDLVNPTDTVLVDDPYWLVYAVASELAFNDLTYESKAADLVAKANNMWSKMVKRNRRGTSDNPRVIRTNVQRIPGNRGGR